MAWQAACSAASGQVNPESTVASPYLTSNTKVNIRNLNKYALDSTPAAAQQTCCICHVDL
jgi:hypothetical protein